MGQSTFDIVARLQLKAEQFSSENGRAFAELETRAKSAASDVRQSFNQSFSEVQRIAQRSLTLPRSATGSLDLSGEIASLNASAAAAENRADAFREMQVAALRAAEAGHSEAAALRQDADAAMVAVRAEEAAAAADRRRIAALEALQGELNQTASVTNRSAAAIGQHAGASDKMRTAMAGASYQVQDFVTQISMGANPMQAFAVQGGQLAGQFMYVEGAAGNVARFMMGGWGIALQVGVMALAPLVSKLWDTDEASKAAQKSTEELASYVGNIANYFDTATGAVKEYNRALVQGAVVAAKLDRTAAERSQQNAREVGAAALASSTERRMVGGGSYTPGGGYSGQSMPGSNDIRDLFASGKNIDAGLARIATSDSTNAEQARTILQQRGIFVKAARDIAKSDAEVKSLLSGTLDPSLKSKSVGGGRSSKVEAIEREVKLATAVNATERARAAYDIVRARGEAAEKAGGAALVQYRKDLTAASEAVNAAEAAEKRATAARTAHSRATREAASLARKTETEAQRLSYVGGRAGEKASELVGRRTSSNLEQLFDEATKSLEKMVAEGEPLRKEMIDAYKTAADALRDAALSLTDLLGIHVRGPASMLLQPGGVDGQSFGTAKVLTDALVRNGLKISPDSLNKLTGDLATVIGNATYGQIGGSVFASITGGKQSKLGSSLGGVVGGELGKLAGPALGKALGSVVGPALGKSLGSLAGPLGAIAGGVLGSVIGGLFKKKSPSGSVDITGTDKSGATASGKLGSALTGDAANVQKSLTQIAQQLGAVTGAFSVSIGRSGDWFHVAGQAGADVSAAHPKSALIYEGKDEAAAVQAAILNALQDGAIKGISEAAQRILKSGQDLDTALTKALLIEAVPRDLKAMLDPVGAAIDDLNRKWKTTVDALKEGGASAEQMAQAEQLYNLQLDQTKNSTSSASQALKDFMTSLKLGSSSPYSLRDQEGTAKAQLQPYLDEIAAGQSIDQSKYQTAANAFLDIERQLYGSTQAYFDALDSVQAATNKAISAIDNASPITAAVPDPFTKATADNTAQAVATAKVGNEMAEDTNALLARIAARLDDLSAGGGSLGSDFIGAARRFVA